MNPLTGASPERAKPVEWAMGVELERSFPLIDEGIIHSCFGDYVQQFGAVTKKQSFLDGHVYRRDSAQCQLLLEYY